MGMNKNYDSLTAREKNRIITAVNMQQSFEAAGFKTSAEKDFYDAIWADAKSLFDRGGVWPIFDLCELD